MNHLNTAGNKKELKDIVGLTIREQKTVFMLLISKQILDGIYANKKEARICCLLWAAIWQPISTWLEAIAWHQKLDGSQSYTAPVFSPVSLKISHGLNVQI